MRIERRQEVASSQEIHGDHAHEESPGSQRRPATGQNDANENSEAHDGEGWPHHEDQRLQVLGDFQAREGNSDSGDQEDRPKECDGRERRSSRTAPQGTRNQSVDHTSSNDCHRGCKGQQIGCALAIRKREEADDGEDPNPTEIL